MKNYIFSFIGSNPITTFNFYIRCLSMRIYKNNNLFFFETKILFFRQDIYFYTYTWRFLRWIKLHIPQLSKNILLASYNVVNNNGSTALHEKLINYVDDLDKFDIHNRNYRLFRNLEKNVSRKFSKQSSATPSTKFISRSIYDTTTGMVKSMKSWQHYLKGRYGVGNGLTRLFKKYSGTIIGCHTHTRLLNVYSYSSTLRFFFFFNIEHFDYLKAYSNFQSYYRHKYRFTFKGWCYLNHYPVNGQKRRTNYKTTRRYNQLVVLKMKK